LPDYYTFNFSFSPSLVLPLIPPWVLVSGSVTITKHGQLYGGIGGGVGVPGWQAAVRAGYIDKFSPAPTSKEIDNFVQGSGVTSDLFFPEYGIPEVIGIGPSVAGTSGYPGSFSHLSNFSTEVGFGVGTAENVSAMYSYYWHL
jgi:hypothetical protein